MEGPVSQAKAIEDYMLQLLDEASRRGHPTLVLQAAANLDFDLQLLLESKMPNYSGKIEKSFFGDNGALQSFSVKIDLAYALGIIDQSFRQDLKVLKNIRNKFAHPVTALDFDSPEIIALIQNFQGYEATKERHKFFLDKSRELSSISADLIAQHRGLSFLLQH